MISRNKRTEVIDLLEKEFSEATGIYLTDFNAIDVEKITKLRRSLLATGSKYLVVKNTLASIALERCNKKELVPYLKGPIGIAFTTGDSTAPARVIREFHKEYKDLLNLSVAYVDGSLFDSKQVMKLADLPSREVLLSQLLSCLKAPMAGLAGSLNGILTKLVGTLEAVKEQKAAQE